MLGQARLGLLLLQIGLSIANLVVSLWVDLSHVQKVLIKVELGLVNALCESVRLLSEIIKEFVVATSCGCCALLVAG